MMNEQEINVLLHKHFNIWSDRDNKTRRTASERVYTSNVTVISHYRFEGIDILDKYIQHLLDERPGYSFEMLERAEAHNDIARVNWKFGPPDDPERVTGQDIFSFEGGKIKSLFVFLDRKQPGKPTMQV